MSNKLPMMSISEEIWDRKYRLKDKDNNPVDDTVYATCMRVAKALASVEKDPTEWTNIFYTVIRDMYFLPAGRILAGAGAGEERSVTLHNCYVSGTIQDSIEGIFNSLKEAALTLKKGGGIGYDFSTLRPKGSWIKGVGSDSCGPLGFMNSFNAMSETIMSAGSRRGAMIGVLRVDHPDIEEFISAKSDPLKLRQFNVSVGVTEEFLDCLNRDSDFDLRFDGKVYRTVKAADLWKKIIRSTYDTAEPGVVFIDRVNKYNNLWYCETISATNPCLTGDTLVTTDKGAFRIQDIIGVPVKVWDSQRWEETTFRVTGQNQKILEIELYDGSIIKVTPYHTMYLSSGEKVLARDLIPDMYLQSTLLEYDGPLSHPSAYLKGFLLMGGCYNAESDKAELWLPENKYSCEERLIESLKEMDPESKVFFRRVGSKTRYLKRTSRYTTLVPWVREYREGLHPDVFRWTRKAKLELLAGIFDSCAHDHTFEWASFFSIKTGNEGLQLLRDIQVLMKSVGLSSRIKKVETGHSLVTGSLGEIPVTTIIRGQVKEPRFFYQNKIVSITESEPSGYVYCCTVKTTNKFALANGVISGNCGEQPLPPYGSCLLGSVNLAQFVTEPFSSHAEIDFNHLKKVVSIAVRALDNVVEVSKYPLPEQKREANEKRRIGLGVTGLADCLIMLGLNYSSRNAQSVVEHIMETIRDQAYTSSTELAQEKGPFPLFDREKYLNGEFIKKLPPHIRDRIYDFGIRNSHLLSIAPTGTISLFANNASSGIEPLFACEYDRKVTQKDGTRVPQKVRAYSVELFRQKFPGKELPSQFVTAQTLSVDAHIQMQGLIQNYVDASISKTINVPEDYPFEKFSDVYLKAYNAGCKGCTTYRPNSVTGSILSVTSEQAPQEPMIKITPRPKVLTGRTYKFNWPPANTNFYVTINNNEKGEPQEIFFSSKHMPSFAWTTALALMISAIWRRGGDTYFIVEELKGVFDPSGGAFVDGKFRPSIISMIGDIIDLHLKGVQPEIAPVKEIQVKTGSKCPKCGSSVIKEEGCEKCTECDWGKCG